MPTAKSTLFMVNKDEWDTKEKIKPVALVIVELRESEGIRQAVI